MQYHGESRNHFLMLETIQKVGTNSLGLETIVYQLLLFPLQASKHLAVSPHCPLLFLPVLSLPRGASVEWHCVAVKGPSELTCGYHYFRLT